MRGSAQKTIVQHGFNSSVSGAEDVWTQGATWVAPIAATLHHIKSSVTSDDVGAVGATSVQVYGLDANYDQINETVTMNGTTNVTTANEYLRVNRMIVRAASDGGFGYNYGNITATTSDAAGTVTCAIAAGISQSRQAIYTIPHKTVGILRRLHGGVSYITAARADISVWIRPQGEVWQLVDGATSVGGTFDTEYSYGLMLPEYSDVRVRAVVNTVSAMNATMHIELDLKAQGHN